MRTDVIFQTVYGSRLYGTATAKSDTDLKSVYLPDVVNMLLGKKLQIFKTRVDAQGKKVPDKASMPDNGVENEYFPFQTFVRDFIAGQTYAIEMAWGLLAQGPASSSQEDLDKFKMLETMVSRFSNTDVHSMVGFAAKQTFDYVHRGRRLNEAVKVRDVLLELLKFNSHPYDNPPLRLDHKLTSYNDRLALDVVAELTGLSIGESPNNNKVQRTLELNGRSYLETASVSHILVQVNKLIDAYGERTTKAAKTDVDFKSLSHAVRVYQQSLELLQTGRLEFPRKNAAELLAIKEGDTDLEVVKELLVRLEQDVSAADAVSSHRRRTPKLEAEAEQWLAEVLLKLYGLAYSS